MNDQDAIAQLAARFPLDKLRMVKEAADPGDPDMALLDGAIARLEARDAKVSSQYEAQKLPEPVNPTLGKAARAVDRGSKWLFGEHDDDATLKKGVARRGLDFAQGTAAGFLSSIPGLGPGLEAMGDFERTILPGNRSRLFPAPGGLNATIEQSPSPTLSRVSGMVAAPAIGAGLSGAGAASEATKAAANAANAPSVALFKGGTEAAKGIPLVGKIAGAPTVVGSGLAGAGAGSIDATVRRIPDVVLPGRHPQSLQPWSEIIEPGIMGAAMGLPAGAMENATAPGTPKNGKLSGGQIAKRYADDRLSGKSYSNEGRDDLVRELEDTKARTKEESDAAIAGAKAQGETALANEARTQELGLRERFSGGRKVSKDTFDEGLLKVINHPEFVHEDGSIYGVSPKPLLEKLKAEAEPFQSQAAAGADAKEAKHLAIGKELVGAIAELEGYLGPVATIRDVRNGYLALQKKAESGTPLQKYAFSKIIGHLRDFAEEIDQTGTLRDLNAQYRSAAHQRERVRGIVYGKEDEKLGENTQQERFDDPDSAAGSTEISPQEELRGAARLAKTGEPTVAGHDAELRGYGYGDLLDAIESRKRVNAENLQNTERTQAERTAEEVGQSKWNLSDYEHGREAALASEWPGTLDVARALVPGAIGAAVHGSNPHLGLVAEGISLIDLARKLRKPMRSRAAYYLPDAEAYKDGLGTQFGLVPQLAVGGRVDDGAKEAAARLRRMKALQALGIQTK